MKFALVQPNWDFAGSTYFGCRDTHLPLELLYARQQLEQRGHEVLLLDAHLEALPLAQACQRVEAFGPDYLVVTTAPTYLFWRCPQPELTVPGQWMRALRGHATTVAIGPHGSATPQAAARKLQCDVVLRGEADLTLAQLAEGRWTEVEGCCWQSGDHLRVHAASAAVSLETLGALDFHDYPLHLRRHRHHVFSGAGRGAELEFSRGCPWACTFCNKTLFRNRLRQRRVEDVLAEAEQLVRHGFHYVYFIDEIFGCSRQTRDLLEGLAQLPLSFGMQTRIDLWNEESIEWLGRAHCISLECGVESITPEGRERFRKGCRMETERISQLLRLARRQIPWVQANLIADEQDDLAAIEAWRNPLIAGGVWVSRPVPVFPFPGSPLYTHLFGAPDDQAWERAHHHYLAVNNQRGYYSDVQSPQPRPLPELESSRKAG